MKRLKHLRNNIRKGVKLILTGPPGAGKTTIQRVYFEMANPLKLLNFSLEPTKGAISNVFSYFNKEFAIFDLAGQENNNWFTHERGIFNGSSAIICIFDIKNSLEFIFQFLIKVFKLQKDLGLRRCKIIIFLHKIDLIGLSYINLKIKKIKEFYKLNYADGRNFNIYMTSITDDFFFQTYKIILEIINQIFKKETTPHNKADRGLLEKDIYILLNCKKKIYNEKELAEELNTKKLDLRLHLSRLKQIGFFTFFSDLKTFQLTERASYFKKGLEKEIKKTNSYKNNKSLETINVILNLNKQYAKI